MSGHRSDAAYASGKKVQTHNAELISDRRESELNDLLKKEDTFVCPWCEVSGEPSVHNVSDAKGIEMFTGRLLCDGCASVGERF